MTITVHIDIGGLDGMISDVGFFFFLLSIMIVIAMK